MPNFNKCPLTLDERRHGQACLRVEVSPGGWSTCQICSISDPTSRLAAAVDQRDPDATSDHEIDKHIHKHIDDADFPTALNVLIQSGLDVRSNGHLLLQRALYGPIDHSLKVVDEIAAAGDIELFDHLVARGANSKRCLALHAVLRCKDAAKMVAMIDHLIDIHQMDVNFNNEDLRDYFHASPDSGGPLHAAVYHKNLVAVKHLLKRGADPKGVERYQDAYRFKGTYRCGVMHLAIDGDCSIPQAYLPAVGPLLDAGANIDHAFIYAVERNMVGAAKSCLDRGVDPTAALKEVDDREARKLAGTPEDEDESMWEQEERELEHDPEAAERRREMIELLAMVRERQIVQ
ncbi:hypothetical protein LTR95_013070 [Oleoguttula sp. CCFEE 5521]